MRGSRTKVPPIRPVFRSRVPLPSRVARAWRRVMRLTPREAAKESSRGRRSPGTRSPRPIRSVSQWAIVAWAGTPDGGGNVGAPASQSGGVAARVTGAMLAGTSRAVPSCRFCLDRDAAGRRCRRLSAGAVGDHRGPRGDMDGTGAGVPAEAGPTLPASLCEAVDVLRGRRLRSASWPAGSPTGTTRSSPRRRAPTSSASSAPGSGALAIDRDNEYRNSVIAAGTGVGAPVHAYVPEESALVIGFIEGRTFERRGLRHAGGRSTGSRRRVPTAARRPPLRQRLRHVRHPGAATSGSSSTGGSGCPTTTWSMRRPWSGSGGPWPSGGAHGGVQQRPAGRQLHRRRRTDPADRLRVLRQQRPLLRARQHLERVPPVAATSSSTW